MWTVEYNFWNDNPKASVKVYPYTTISAGIRSIVEFDDGSICETYRENYTTEKEALAALEMYNNDTYWR